MVAVLIHCVGYRYIAIAIICYCSNGVGIVFFNSIDELAFVKCYGIVMVTVSIHSIGYAYVSLTIIRYGSNGVGIVFFNGVNELAFIKAYGIVVITVCINSFSNIYITIAIILRGSNGVGILSIFLNKALQSIFINTNYIILIIQIATAYAVIYSNDNMTGFCGGNGVGVICLNSFNELIFINSYGIIVVTVIINHFGNIYITLAIILCGSNSVGVILLNKIAQLLAVDINLISMITFYAFICNFQHIGCGLYGSNGISINNILQLIGYPAAGSNAFYLCLHAVLVGILNLYRQLAIFIQASFHTGIGSISVNGIFLNGLHELIFIEAYSIIIVTVIIHTTVNSYIILTIILCSSNGVGVILLNKIAQLLAVDINLISMITFYAFICNFQHIGCGLYGSNGISINNILQLIGYPAAGSNAFYLCLHAVLVGILNLYRQLAIFIQTSFHAGVSCVGILRCRCILNKSPQSILVDADSVMFVIGCWIISISIVNGNDRMTGFCCGNRISIANAIQLIGYPLLGSDAVYRACKGSTGIISNLGSQRAVCKGQFIINNFGISINNTNCNPFIVFAY